ncbi:TnsA endonuclease N-terminal domain-containing protein [Aeromonas veronii]|uniref:TnsA endonuclease N-terminal domain-containing protein n=1 Tax=Aeromonas TaxID=642 RepID=UPI000BFEA451|nr:MULTISPECIES: TnsA endonuclease N-terminal domain-containing protein [Aeromonas]ATL92167.1 transposase [Aeromonas sp. CU5]UYB72575.1 TnsA endonuclease N-terminal domain-containing protein [Aeromonas veronii]
MQQKTVQQPIVTDAEIAKTARYNRDIKASGYRPWVTVRQSHTYGQGQIVFSHKTGREHHLLSRGERLPFFAFEHDASVIDILEQYPLPLHQTLEIAASLNVVHPGNYQERGNHGGRIPAKTMTQDYVVLRQSDSGKARLTAYSFKYSDALDPAITSPRVVNRTRAKEKIALEYWRTQNVDHVLVTEKDFDATFIYNLEFLRECYDSKNLLQVSADFYDNVIVQFKSHMMTAPLSTLRMLIQQVAHEINIDELQVACLFQHAVYTGRIDIDLTQRIELYHPLPALRGSRAD